MGNKNAAVFPVPVCAHPNTSRPLSKGGNGLRLYGGWMNIAHIRQLNGLDKIKRGKFGHEIPWKEADMKRRKHICFFLCV